MAYYQFYYFVETQIFVPNLFLIEDISTKFACLALLCVKCNNITRCGRNHEQMLQTLECIHNYI